MVKGIQIFMSGNSHLPISMPSQRILLSQRQADSLPLFILLRDILIKKRKRAVYDSVSFIPPYE